jgi:hypothetical protein
VRGIARILDEIAIAAHCFCVDLVVTGSIAEGHPDPADVDLWLDGDCLDVATLGALLDCLSHERRWNLDLWSPTFNTPPALRVGQQWRAAHGIPLAGALPPCPNATKDQVVRAIRDGAALAAVRLVEDAALLAPFRSREAAMFAEAGARSWIRSKALVAEKWRAMNRTAAERLPELLAPGDHQFARLVRSRGWGDPSSVHVLHRVVTGV